METTEGLTKDRKTFRILEETEGFQEEKKLYLVGRRREIREQSNRVKSYWKERNENENR